MTRIARRPSVALAAAAVAALAGLAASCSAGSSSGLEGNRTTPSASMSGSMHGNSAAGRPGGRATGNAADNRAANANSPLPGMPPVLDPHDIYAADRPNQLSPVVKHDRPLVYVPNTLSNTVSVIDPATYHVIATHQVGALPQHVVPSWDLKTLYVLNDNGNSVTTIDPRNGHFGRTLPVADPYNMYFTPNGRYAIAVAERLHRLDFLDPHTMKLHKAVPVGCSGVDHADFSANGRYAIFSCEFSGQLLKIDVLHQRVVGYLRLPSRNGRTPMPQDVKVSPDGKTFYVADMASNGVWLINGKSLKIIGFRATGRGAHGLYVSRDSRYLYVTNRDEGSISLIDLRTRRVAKKWWLKGGGSPDMGGLSADGKVLWLSGRYNAVVYAISTRNGHLIARIPVGSGPHGLCVYPQPGRYSLGHTGIFR